MRESLFRGKYVVNGEWVEGYYVRLHDSKGHESHRIYTGYAETDCGDFYPDWFEVDPATVGRYAGLTANGKKIFEGDVFRYGLLAVEAVAVVKFGEYSFGSKFDMNCVGFYVEWPPQAMYYRTDLGFWAKQRKIEIIGNIHDNPELLEEVQ